MYKKNCYRSLRFYRYIFVGLIIISISIFFLPSLLNKFLNDDIHSGTIWNTKTNIVFLLFSSPMSTTNRQTIRETWLSLPSVMEMKVFFSIGTNSLTKDEVGSLINEHEKYADLLLLPDLYDSYKNLTYKLVESIIWLDKNIISKYLFKGDDDTFVWLEKFNTALIQKPKSKLYWGFFYGKANVKTSGKWAESEWVMCDRYLPHARGGGYVLSWDLVKYISVNHHLLQKFNSEDISLGAWLGPLKLERQHDVRFNTEYKSRGCNQQYIVTHKQSPDMMRSSMRTIINRQRMCRSEIRVRLSYEYNWKVPPSLCCIRNNSSIP